MFKFFQRPSSANVAKNRLKQVLAKDRAGLSETDLNSLKQELYGVISTYFKIEEDSLEVNIQNRDGSSALSVNTPLRQNFRS